MTSRTRTAKQTAAAIEPKPVKKAPTKRPAAAVARAPRKRAPRKATVGAPKLSLVKAPKPLTTRERPFMTDVQGYATLAARIAGILTPRITAWTDHGDGTATRPLKDGTLHYTQDTRTLTWQGTCLMGSVHTYILDSPSTAAAARVQAATCQELHADLTKVKPLTPDELEALGLLQTPTWARNDLLGDDITETIPVPAEPLNRATASAADTQPMSRDAIAAGLAGRAAAQPADTDQTREHPQS